MIRFPLQLFKIEGVSMLPYFRPGEYVITNRLAYCFRKPRAGDVVLCRDPRQQSRLMLKRIVGVGKDGIFVEGDNASLSTDSRRFGPIANYLLAGKVIAHIRRQ